jgi:hypothetical protein
METSTVNFDIHSDRPSPGYREGEKDQIAEYIASKGVTRIKIGEESPTSSAWKSDPAKKTPPKIIRRQEEGSRGGKISAEKRIADADARAVALMARFKAMIGDDTSLAVRTKAVYTLAGQDNVSDDTVRRVLKRARDMKGKR